MTLVDKRKALLILSLAFILPAMARGEKSPLSNVFRLSDATSFVFVDEVQVKEGVFGYRESNVKGPIDETLKAALQETAKQSSSPDGGYPFIGILGRVMLSDEKGKPLCSMEVVNWDRFVVFKGVDNTTGGNLIVEPRVTIKSEAICRWMFDKVRSEMPDDFRRMKERYQRVGKDLEKLIFPPKKDSEPGEADPSAPTADKPTE